MKYRVEWAKPEGEAWDMKFVKPLPTRIGKCEKCQKEMRQQERFGEWKPEVCAGCWGEGITVEQLALAMCPTVDNERPCRYHLNIAAQVMQRLRVPAGRRP